MVTGRETRRVRGGTRSARGGTRSARGGTRSARGGTRSARGGTRSARGGTRVVRRRRRSKAATTHRRSFKKKRVIFIPEGGAYFTGTGIVAAKIDGKVSTSRVRPAPKDSKYVYKANLRGRSYYFGKNKKIKPGFIKLSRRK